MNTFTTALQTRPNVGRRVLYMLNKGDAVAIAEQRKSVRERVGIDFTPTQLTPEDSRFERYTPEEWEKLSTTWARNDLAQAIRSGNGSAEGDVFPGLIVSQWGDSGTGTANLQVFLDGNDTYWATSRSMYRGDEGPEFKADNWYWTQGRWHLTLDGEELDQKTWVEQLEAVGHGDIEGYTTDDFKHSWEPDARGSWVFLDGESV